MDKMSELDYKGKQLVDCMAKFLSLEAEEDDIPEDCYSEEFSDDYDFIDDSEDIENKEQYNEFVNEIQSCFEDIDSPEISPEVRKKNRKRRRRKEKMSKTMSELVESALEKWHAERQHGKKKKPDADKTSLGDEENEASSQKKNKKGKEPAKKQAKKETKKRPISAEIVTSDKDSEDEDETAKEENEENEENEGNKSEIESIPDDAMDSSNEPEVYYVADDDYEDEDVINPDATIRAKCGICNTTLVGGYGEKNDGPWVRCPDKHVCKVTWLAYTDLLQFHKVAKHILHPRYRTPFTNGRPRCDCNAIMAYHWVQKCSQANAKYLKGAIFLVCCLPVKEGGKCEKVIYAGKCSSKEKKPLITFVIKVPST